MKQGANFNPKKSIFLSLKIPFFNEKNVAKK